MSTATFGLATYKGRVERVLAFKNNHTLWCGIGGQDEWAEENNPPAPSPIVIDIDTPILYVKADFVTLCTWSDVEADVEVAGSYYEYASDNDAMDKLARFLYARFTFDGTIQGIPTGTFRQVGIFSNLVPASGHGNDTWLAPADVADIGLLQYISYRRPVTFSFGEIRMEQFIAEFK
jgi:hypothetical protein